MLDDSELDNLPEDPALQFVQLEKKLRSTLENNIRQIENGYGSDLYYLQYMNHVAALAVELQIPDLLDLKVPNTSEKLYDAHIMFIQRVDFFNMRIRIRASRERKENSVSLSEKSKAKIRHYLQQIPPLIDRLDVTESKRASLRNKTHNLMLAVEQERTGLAHVGAILLEVTGLGRKAAKDLKPLKDLIDPVVREVAAAKDAEPPALQIPAPPRRIPGPMSRPPEVDKDDEISF